jgi:hypothetical protein
LSTVIIGGGPRPQARVVQVTEMQAPSGEGVSYEIRDGAEVLATFAKSSHAFALLPLIQSGE